MGEPLDWNEFIVYTSKEAEEAVANILNEQGAKGVVIEDIQDIHKARKGKFGEVFDISTEHYPKTGIRLKSYFYNDCNWSSKKQMLQTGIKQLQQFNIPLGSLRFEESIVNEKDWENEWKKYFTVQKITDQITVVPNWIEYTKKEDDLVLYIDPGMAFGTGTHPTTVLSVAALEKYMHKHDTVIDVGVGSGILSIAACLLGADHVYAYDLDPVAVKSAKMNRNINQLQQKITLEQKNLLKGNKHKGQMIVSNILAEILIDLVEDAWNTLYEGGYFITSGIIKAKQHLIEEKLGSVGFIITEIQEQDHWVSIIAQKKE